MDRVKIGNNNFGVSLADITISCDMDELQSVIDSLPKYLNHSVTINLNDTTLSATSAIEIKGFSGHGQLNIYGDTSATPASGHYEINVGTNNINAIEVVSNQPVINIQGLSLQSSAQNKSGLYAENNSTVYSAKCLIYGFNRGIEGWYGYLQVDTLNLSANNVGIYSGNGRMRLSNCQSGTTNDVYGYHAEAGHIMYAGTTATGATANTYASSGGKCATTW